MRAGERFIEIFVFTSIPIDLSDSFSWTNFNNVGNFPSLYNYISHFSFYRLHNLSSYVSLPAVFILAS